MSGEKVLSVMRSRYYLSFCITKKETASFINLHTASSITNPSSWAHPRTPWSQHDIINSPGVSPQSVVGLDPSEPGPGRSKKNKTTQKTNKSYLVWVATFKNKTFNSFILKVSSSGFQFYLRDFVLYQILDVVYSWPKNRRVENILLKYFTISFI